MSEEPPEQLWHYLLNGEQYGPVNGEQLQELAAAGTIAADTPVWTETLDEWIAAGTVEGLIPAQPVRSGPRLITGADAQTATPLGSAPATAPAPMTVPAPLARPGFALGGSLAGGPHVAGPGAPAGLAPGTEQSFQVRSIGIVQAGVVGALLYAITFLITAVFLLIFGGALAAAMGDGELVGSIAGGGAAMVFLGPIVSGIFGFLYGMIAALIYNLAAKMCGGLVVKMKARPPW